MKTKPDAVEDSTILTGKVSIVTGAGRGLGKAMAIALARAGSSVVLMSRTISEIELVAQQIASLGGKSLAIRTDVTDSVEISRAVDSIRKEYGRIDVLVNNAGQNASHARHAFEDIPEDEWMSMVQTNITGVFLMSQIVGRTMLAQGSGKIINIGSAGAIKVAPESSCYCMTKAAVVHMTKALAVEWANRGVTVNCIAPGSFDMYPGCTEDSYVKMKKQREQAVPLGRLGNVQELAPLLVFYASDASNYITGQTVFMDGGLVAR